MKTHLTLLLILSLISSVAFAQYAGIDHLQPCKYFEDDSKDYRGYHHKIAEVFHLKSNNVTINYIATPSFSPEYAFSLTKAKRKYLLTTRQFSENYWYAENKDNVELLSQERELNKTTAKLMFSLFSIALDSCKNYIPKKNGLSYIGFDGTNYYFSERMDNNFRIGKTWSPSTPKMQELVAICERIRTSQPVDFKKLNKRIKQMISGFEER